MFLGSSPKRVGRSQSIDAKNGSQDKEIRCLKRGEILS